MEIKITYKQAFEIRDGVDKLDKLLAARRSGINGRVSLGCGQPVGIMVSEVRFKRMLEEEIKSVAEEYGISEVPE